jgi:hypothetical protein
MVRGPDLLVSVPQAEFRSSPGATVPEIIKLLEDSDGDVRWTAAETLSQRSKQGKTVKLSNVTFFNDDNSRISTFNWPRRV